MTTDLAYLAGLLDGEGSISLHMQKLDKYELYSFRVLITSTNRPVVDWLAEYFGGSIRMQPRRNDGYKDIYRWCLRTCEAAQLLPLLLPYLIIKKEHALLGIQWLKTVKPGGRYDSQEIEHRDFLFESFVALAAE